MKHQPNRIKFELDGSLIVIDRNRPGSFTAKLYEPLAGGGFSDRPLCRFSSDTRAHAARGVIQARNACYQVREHHVEQALHDETMRGVWESQKENS